MTINGYHGFLIKMEIKLLLLLFNWQILICPLFRRSTTIVAHQTVISPDYSKWALNVIENFPSIRVLSVDLCLDGAELNRHCNPEILGMKVFHFSFRLKISKFKQL